MHAVSENCKGVFDGATGRPSHCHCENCLDLISRGHDPMWKIRVLEDLRADGWELWTAVSTPNDEPGLRGERADAEDEEWEAGSEWDSDEGESSM